MRTHERMAVRQRPAMTRTPLLASVAVAALVAGCTALAPTGPGPTTRAPVPPHGASRWHAPQPAVAPVGAQSEDGRTAALSAWWSQFDDPLVQTLVDAAQAAAPSVAQAAQRIAQAEAAMVGAAGAGLPSVDGSLSGERSAMSFTGPVMQRTLAQAQLRSVWEIDLFGGNRREREAAAARLDARRADWHDARIAIAAEVAAAYVDLRHCEALLRVAQADATSRAETARLVAIAGRAGLQAQAAVAQAKGSLAEAHDRVARQLAACDQLVKGLVALTDLAEPMLRERLADRHGRFPVPRFFQVESLPAALLAQRPDMAALERDLAAASADVGVAEAARYPRLSLAGSIGPIRVSTGGVTISATTWSIGPSLTLPLVDHGRRTANVEAARVAYAAAESAYRARARLAVREVEQALVRLAASSERAGHARDALDGYREALGGADRRHRAGLASLTELEEARRVALQAESTLVDLQHERTSAWISLYRAVGGGWSMNPDSKRAP